MGLSGWLTSNGFKKVGNIPSFEQFISRRMEKFRRVCFETNYEFVEFEFRFIMIANFNIDNLRILLILRNWAFLLLKKNIFQGDILYLSMANCWQFNVTMLGAWHAGLAVSAASPQFTHCKDVFLSLLLIFGNSWSSKEILIFSHCKICFKNFLIFKTENIYELVVFYSIFTF